MRFKGTLLKPLADQHDSDQRYIDPAGVKFNPETDYPIFNNFDYDADKILGSGRITREADGSLAVSGTLREGLHPWQLAIGIRADERSLHQDGVMPITKCEVMSIALTDNHADVTQPNITVRK